ncbi:MAG: PH domain-containing protein, partial [Pauljensenia sp.]
VLGALLLFLLVAGLCSWLSWRATSYAVTDNAVWYRSGILFRSQRHARLDRIQAVDVVHPLLGRLFGLGRLSVEVAGGSGSNLTFGFLSTRVLDDLRAEILARAAGIRLDGSGRTDRPHSSAHTGESTSAGTPAPASAYAPDDEGGAALVGDQEAAGREEPALPAATDRAGAAAAVGAEGRADAGGADVRGAAPAAADRAGAGTQGTGAAGIEGARSDAARTSAAELRPAPVAHEHELYRVPVGRLLGSMLISSGTLIGLLVVLAVVVGVVVAMVQLGARSLTGLVAAIPGILGVASYLWGRFSGEFNFTAAVSPDGIRIRRGLTETRSQTIPPRRVHAVSVTQPFLWRRMGWYRVTITQAGYAGESSESGSSSSSSNDVLLPVGTRADAELAIWLVVRDLGVEDPRAFIEAGLHGQDEGEGYIPNPRRSRVLDPVSWRRRAVALTRTCLVVREGRVSHSLTVAPVERLQSIGVEQGPWQRRLDLATLRMHIVPGSVRAAASHVDAAHAQVLLADLLELGRVRRGSEPPEKWMMRVAAAVPDREVREAIVEDATGEDEVGGVAEVSGGRGADDSSAQGFAPTSPDCAADRTAGGALAGNPPADGPVAGEHSGAADEEGGARGN